MNVHAIRQETGAGNENYKPYILPESFPTLTSGPATDLQGAAGAARCSCLLFEKRPVEGVVVLVVECAEENAKELPEVHVVRSLLEPQASAVVEVHCKLCWKSLKRWRERGCDFSEKGEGRREG